VSQACELLGSLGGSSRDHAYYEIKRPGENSSTSPDVQRTEHSQGVAPPNDNCLDWGNVGDRKHENQLLRVSGSQRGRQPGYPYPRPHFLGPAQRQLPAKADRMPARRHLVGEVARRNGKRLALRWQRDALR
jgi:hypothetical protein